MDDISFENENKENGNGLQDVNDVKQCPIPRITTARPSLHKPWYDFKNPWDSHDEKKLAEELDTETKQTSLITSSFLMESSSAEF